MAINIMTINGKTVYDTYEYVCDFETDVKNLPVKGRAGSRAYIVETGKIYILNTQKKWIAINRSSGGGSGSGTDEDIPSGGTLIQKTITENGIYNASSDNADGYDVVTVDVSPLIVKEKTVNFYNYTGELVHSYTAEEIENLTELPEAPTVQGMTFQNWNWTLADIKTWVQNHDEGNLPVGAVFVTDNGHTRIYMHLREPKMASKKMPFCIQQMAGTVVIDWGDNSQPETITAAGTYSHLWQINSYPADVMIDIEYTPSGTTKLVLGRDNGLFNNETYYASCVEKVEYGINTDMLAYSATFKNCSKLKSINLPMSFTSISSYAFQNCTNLALIVLPDGITSISSYAFQNCTNLALTVLPDGITSIGESAFQGCTSLALTVLPDGITLISSGAFNECTNLALTVLPDGATSIGGNTFRNCTNLALIVLPDGITSISSYAFLNCTSLYFIDLTAFTDPQAIPTLASTAFYNIPATAQFIVANQEMYDAFTTATNWSTYASKFVIKEAS